MCACALGIFFFARSFYRVLSNINPIMTVLQIWVSRNVFVRRSGISKYECHGSSSKKCSFRKRRRCKMNRPTHLSSKITQLFWNMLLCHVWSTLAYIYLYLWLSTVWGERGFSLMNNIKIKRRNRMNTNTLDDSMMICSNGPPVSTENTNDIDVILDPVCLYTFFYVQI